MDKTTIIIPPARNLEKEINIKLYKGIMMIESKITLGVMYEEVFVVYKSGEGYISYLRPYKDIEYTPSIYRAKEFKSKAEALQACVECELDYIRVDKINKILT